MPRYSLHVNGRQHTVEVPAETPLLWVLRDELQLKGTKYSCGRSQCGTCTVHLDGRPARACVLAVSAVGERAVTTIEGLGLAGMHALQRAWLAEQVPQCGYCHPGILMQAAALLAENPRPSSMDIDRALAGMLCRCGTYLRIRRAVRRAAEEVADAR